MPLTDKQKTQLRVARNRTRIKDNDLGYRRIVKGAQKLGKRSTFSVGVFDSNPFALMKAVIHEFGENPLTVGDRKPTPPRYWLSKYFDDQKLFIADVLKEMYVKIAVSGGVDKEMLYKEYSAYLLADLRDYMKRTDFPPPLKEITWLGKTTPYPLIETSEMMYATAIRVSRSSKGGSGGKQIAPAPGASSPGGGTSPMPTPPKTPGGRNEPTPPGLGDTKVKPKPGPRPKPTPNIVPPPTAPKPPKEPRPPGAGKKPRTKRPRRPRPLRPRRQRQQRVRGTGRRAGRTRSSNVIKKLRAIAKVLTGPSLYEGYGQRKRPDRKPGTSTTVKWGSGYKRMPVRSKGGRYPSDSRPKK
jgi:hypothetical protein